MLKVWKDLDEDVVKPGFCIGCGACVATCPVSCLELQKGQATLVATCINCGICYAQCPESIDLKTLRKEVFPETTGDEAGDIRQILTVEAKDPELKKKAQDGGAVASILGTLLEYEYIDAAIVTGIGPDPWSPIPRVATTESELIECAGSKYTRGAIYPSIYDAVKHYYKKRLAVVGLPLQIAATRRTFLSKPTNRHIADAIKLRVGIFCGGAFVYKFFKEVVEGQANVPLYEVDKFDIKGEKFLIYRPDKPVREIPLAVARKYMDLPCRICPDYTAELADISVGSVGAPENSSTVIIRTQVGEDAFNFARKFDKFTVSPKSDSSMVEAVRRQAKSKRESAERELDQLKKQGKKLPVWKTA